MRGSSGKGGWKGVLIPQQLWGQRGLQHCINTNSGVSFVWLRGSLLGLFSALLCLSWARSRAEAMLSWETSPGLGAAAMIASQWFFPGRRNRMCKATWFQHPWEAASWNLCVSSIILSFYIASQVETWATTEGKWDGGRRLRLAEEGTYQKAHTPFSKTAEREERLEHSRRYR